VVHVGPAAFQRLDDGADGALLVAEPDIAALPFAIRSASADAVEAALACLQGRAVVLDAEAAGASAARIERYGAAVMGGKV
jgi:5-methyltetrahydrofolate--homocysteine methyltransferase